MEVAGALRGARSAAAQRALLVPALTELNIGGIILPDHALRTSGDTDAWGGGLGLADAAPRDVYSGVAKGVARLTATGSLQTAPCHPGTTNPAHRRGAGA